MAIAPQPAARSRTPTRRPRAWTRSGSTGCTRSSSRTSPSSGIRARRSRWPGAASCWLSGRSGRPGWPRRPRGHRRHALAALLADQGHHGGRDLGAGGAGRADVRGPHRGPCARVRGEQQGRDHAAPGADPPGRLPERAAGPRSGPITQLLRKVCDFELEWWPGSKVHYHGASAHWTCAVLIEAVTGRDFREFIRSEVLDPLGIDDIQVGVPADMQDRCADMHAVVDGQHEGLGSRPDAPLPSVSTTPAFRAAGIPGGGGYATAAALAGVLSDARGWRNAQRHAAVQPPPDPVGHPATRRATAPTSSFGFPMHRGLGPHVRGTTPVIRGLGSIAPPARSGTAARAPRTRGQTRSRAFRSPT